MKNVLASCAVAASLVLTAPVAHAAEALPVASSSGITVTKVTAVSERTWELTVSTDAITSGYATKGELSVRVTLPRDYATSGKRYPTLYLLHGQDGTARDWTSGQGDAEKLTDGTDVIVVTPDGGKAGWYTDWVRQWAGKQRWESFHIDQLIPFIDANFRTMATHEHRAIAGLSMGGYGAMHYATKHPELFNHVSSYSGELNLLRPDARFAVLYSVNDQRLGIDAPFGSVVGGFDGVWHSENPFEHAEKLRRMGISIYTGDGLGTVKDVKSNLIEQGAAGASNDLHGRLTQLGIRHTWVAYGHDVTKAGYNCDGGHDWPCWNMDLALDLPAIMRDIA